MAHDPNLEISDANCSRGYPMTPCADVLLDEVVLNFISSKAPPFGRGFLLDVFSMLSLFDIQPFMVENSTVDECLTN
jgi:hypothetical protein